jgi:transcriptional regulator with XRE-family HTH domain
VSTLRSRPAAEPGEHVYRTEIDNARAQHGLDQLFNEGLLKRFFGAPLKVCSVAIGKWIRDRLHGAGWTQNDLAAQIGVDRTAVTYWIQGGGITLDNLSRVLLAFKCQWSDLPIPARRDLACAAYRAALEYTRKKLKPDETLPRLAEEQFWCLYHLLSHSDWRKAQANDDDFLRTRAAAQVQDAVRKELGTGEDPVVTVEGLTQLVEEWGEAWLHCVYVTTERWADQ